MKIDEKEIIDIVSKVVDDWVDDFIGTLVSSDLSGPKRGLWDRFKGGFANLVYGRDHKKNPYYWKNRFGDDLGVQEHFGIEALTLSEYSLVRSAVEDVESEVKSLISLCEEDASAVEKLRIVKMIRASAQALKTKVISALTGSAPTPTTPAPKSPAPTTPAPKSPVPTTPAPKSPAPTTPAPTTPAPKSPAPTTPAPKSPKTEPITTEPITKPKKSSDASSAPPNFEENLRNLLGGGKTNQPNKNWLDGGGKILEEALPSAINWLASRGVDISDDAKVMEALAKEDEIKDEFKGVQERPGGNSLLLAFVNKSLKADSDTNPIESLAGLGVRKTLLDKTENEAKIEMFDRLKGLIERKIAESSDDSEKKRLKDFFRHHKKKLESESLETVVKTLFVHKEIKEGLGF